MNSVKRNRFNPAVLRQRREQLDVTQQELADGAGFSRHALSLWETGKKTPELDYYMAWVDALGLKPGAGLS